MSLVVNGQKVSTASGDSVQIDSLEMVNALVQNNADVLQMLRDQIGPVYMADISIDGEGRVVISNKAFTEAMTQKLGGIGAAGSAIALGGLGCGGGCVNFQ